MGDIQTNKVVSEPSADALPAEIHGPELKIIDTKLWNMFSATADSFPDRDAVVSMWQDDSLHPVKQQYLRWSYHTLRTKAESLAAKLSFQKFRAGTIFLVAKWNSADWCLCFWAAAKLGMVFVPLDPRLEDETLEIIQSINPALLVVELNQVEKIQGFRDYSTVSIDGFDIWVRPTISVFQQPLSEDTAIVVFTSGTTRKSKGCVHSHANLMAQTYDHDPGVGSPSPDRWLVHTPIWHIFAINNVLRAWRYGGTVVFPSRSFDIDATVAALATEKCTIMSATPTLAKALGSHAKFSQTTSDTLSIITIAGTAITEADINYCRTKLEAKDAIQVYGTSEGGPLISWSRQDPSLINGYHEGVGKPLPGVSLRVCSPGTIAILQRGEAGELHVGGPSVIQSYISLLEDSSLYHEGDKCWHVTGDQAIIDSEGIVHILGRYKDLIIRGGENISPTTIEAAILQLPGVEVQVVGIENQLAGEVPVAVVKLPEGISKAQVLQAARALGLKHSLHAVYTLGDLQLCDFPTTALNKPKKHVLKDLIIKKNADFSPINHHSGSDVDSMVSLLSKIWFDLLGFYPKLHDEVTIYADSITRLQYCDAVYTKTGKHLYLQDFVHHSKLYSQVELLQQRSTADDDPLPTESCDQIKMLSDIKINCPKGQTDLVSTCNIQLPRTILSLAQSYAKELNQNYQIQALLPIRSSHHFMARGLRSKSYHVALVFKIPGVGVSEMQTALEKTLYNRPLFRSVLYSHASQKFHAIIKACKELYEELIEIVDASKTQSILSLCTEKLISCSLTPFMFKAFFFQGSQNTIDNQHFAVIFNHSIIDALSLWSWQRDFTAYLLGHRVQKLLNPGYEMFTDLFHQYELSAASQQAVSWHVKRLRGISYLQESLWPPQRAPGWIISDGNSTCTSATDRSSIREQLWGGQWEARKSEFEFPHSARIVRLSNISTLKQKLGISEARLMRCALIIFNVLQTKSQTAIFSSWESGMSWPLALPWMKDILPSPQSIEGPMVERILNVYRIDPEETVSKFMKSIQTEEAEESQHVHAPWDQVVDQMGDEFSVLENAVQRQTFVWDMSLGVFSRQSTNPVSCLEVVARYDWPDCGICWNAFMMNSEHMYFVASWDTAQMTAEEVEDYCDKLASVIRLLDKQDCWEKTLREVFCL